MSKASAVAFAVVVLFVVLAGYVAYTNIQDNVRKPAVITPKVSPSPTSVAHMPPSETPAPASPVVVTDTPAPVTWSPTPAPPTSSATPTPMPTPTSTATATRTLAPTIGVRTPTMSPTATHGPSATPTPTKTPAAQPTVGTYTFYLDGSVYHDLQESCLAQYLRGMVRDKKGNPLEGVHIKAYDLWGNEAHTLSKGGIDIGKWDIVLGGTPNIWHVVVLDAAGNVISPVAIVPHHQEDEFKNACTHVVNWRRAW